MPSNSLDRWARRIVLPGLALVAVTVVAACGGSTPAASAPPPAAPKASTPNRAQQGPPGTFGTIAAASGTSLEVQNPQNGQVTVNFNGSTTFTNTTAATLADVTVGSCVAVTATSGGNMPATLTARSVSLTPSSSNGCTAGAFGGGGGNGAGRPSNAPRPSNRPRPSGAPGAPGAPGGRSFGSVTAVSATGFTVHNTNPRAGQSADTTVTINSSTTYTKTASATSSALAVGECVAAIGPADDTGAITARTIAISKPGPSGCTTGRFRGGFGGGNG